MGKWKTFWLIGEDKSFYEQVDDDLRKSVKKTDAYITYENENVLANDATSPIAQNSTAVTGTQPFQSPYRNRRISQKQLRRTSKGKQENRRHGIVAKAEIPGKKMKLPNHGETQKEKLDTKLSAIIDSDSEIKVVESPKTNRKVHFVKNSGTPTRTSIDSVRDDSHSGRDSGIDVCYVNPEWMNINTEEVEKL